MKEAMKRYLLFLLPACAVALAAVILLPASSGARRATPGTQARPAVSDGLIIGLSEGGAGWGGQSTGPRLDALMTTGAKWYRDAFWWYQIEPRPGRFSFAYYDHYVLLAAERGLHIVPQLEGTPAWAGASSTTLPAHPAVFAKFVAALVHRYGTGGTFWRAHPTLAPYAITTWELWNEPYFSSGNGGVWNPGLYARLVKAASIAGRALDPSAKFLIEAEMESYHTSVWTWWVDALYQAMPNFNRYFQGVAVHDFGTNVTSLSPIVYGQPYPNFGRIRRIEDLRRQFVRHGAADKPFWIMESGWSTCTQQSVDCVTPAQQAADLETMWGYLHTTWKSWVQALFVYRYQDGDPSNSVQGGYGLVKLNGTPKPAFQIFKSYAAQSAN